MRFIQRAFRPNILLAFLLNATFITTLITTLGYTGTAYAESQGSESRDTPLISLSAEGKVTATPNQATLAMRFVDTQFKADDARRTVDQQVRTFLDELKAYDVEQSSLDTSQTQIYPQYDYRNNERQLKGYQVVRNVRLVLLNLEQLEGLLKTLTEISVAQLNTIEFGLSNLIEIKQQALSLAIKNSEDLAKQIAEGYGVKLGKIHTVNYQTTPSRTRMRTSAMSLEMAESSTNEPSYHQKDIEFIARVSVDFTFE